MERPIEETLQAYLDGELAAADAGALEARIAADEDVRQRLEMLRAAKAALEETAVPAAMPDDLEARVRRDLEHGPGQAPRAVRRRVALWVGASLAAAAALLIAVVLLETGGTRDPAPEPKAEAKQQEEDATRKDERFETESEWLAFRVVREARPARVFDDVVFTVEVRARKAFGLVCLVPRKPGETLEALAERLVTKEILSPPKVGIMPVTLTASIRTPDGRELEGRLEFPDRPTLTPLHAEGETMSIRAKSVSWMIPLSKILVRARAIRPYFGVVPDGKGGWIADQLKAFARIPGHRMRSGDETKEQWLPFFPDRPGHYLVRFHMHTLPGRKEYSWPQAEGRLDAGVGFVVTGVTGKWSKPENGLSFRLAAPRKVWRKGEVVPIALQIRNDADAPRQYNFFGTTMAKIPQPYHFQLFLDGKDDPAKFTSSEINGGFTFHGGYMFARHAPGVIRTVVFPLNCWSQGDHALAEIPGRHTLRCRFHFTPSFWSTENKEIWLGKVDVPGLEFEIVEEEGAGQRDGGAK